MVIDQRGPDGKCELHLTKLDIVIYFTNIFSPQIAII